MIKRDYYESETKGVSMSYDNDNIFAKILRGEIPCDKVFEDEHVLAFRDINPRRKVHVLVIPKRSYGCYQDFVEKAEPAEMVAYFRAVSDIAKQLGVAESGYRLIANRGANGGQEVPHFHMHILGGEAVGPMVG